MEGLTFVERFAQVPKPQIPQFFDRTVLRDVGQFEVEQIVTVPVIATQNAEVMQIVGRTVSELYHMPVPQISDEIAEGALDVLLQRMVALAIKDLSDLKNWLADLERIAAASDGDDAAAHVAHGRQRYGDKKIQLVTSMRRLQKVTTSSSARPTKQPRR